MPHAYVQLIGESYQQITSNYTDAIGQIDIGYKELGTFTKTVNYFDFKFEVTKFYTGQSCRTSSSASLCPSEIYNTMCNLHI